MFSHPDAQVPKQQRSLWCELNECVCVLLGRAAAAAAVRAGNRTGTVGSLGVLMAV